MKLKKSVKKFLLGSMILGVGLTATSLAYFTDSEKATNKFEVGKLSIELSEPNYVGNDRVGAIVGHEYVEKNPLITNTNNTDAVVFMTVTMPMHNLILINDDGTRTEELTESFYLKNAKTPNKENNYNGNFILLNTETENNEKTYTFGYNTKLAPTESALPLFNYVQLKQILEGNLTTVDDIDIKAYGIQANDIIQNGVIANTDGVIDRTVLEYAYQVYLNQRGG